MNRRQMFAAFAGLALPKPEPLRPQSCIVKCTTGVGADGITSQTAVEVSLNGRLVARPDKFELNLEHKPWDFCTFNPKG